MPTFRIVYIDTDRIDDTGFTVRTLTATFPDRASAEDAMARHGHRIAHLAELGAGETVRDAPVLRIEEGAAILDEPARPARRARARWTRAVPVQDLAAAALVAAGAVMACVAVWLF
jgi:hypothetical protein